MGELDDDSARRLVAAGVARYNHNLETSRRHFATVVGSHSYDDRLATLRSARRAGMKLCCGGIFGIGEQWCDRIELAITLRDEVKPDLVPINFLDPIAGTKLGRLPPLPPQECLLIVAMLRFLLPRTNLKIAGGRRNLRDLQSWLIYAGASSLMTGNYLTTCGRDGDQDKQMLADLGLTLANEHETRISDNRNTTSQ
jgi:biotin synthase